MDEDVESILTRELRQVADRLEVPPLPELPADPPRRVLWQPVLAAAAVLLIAVVTLVTVSPDRGDPPQPAPQPTDVATDDATGTLPQTVPTGPPTVPYLLGREVRVSDESYPGYDWVEGTADGWIAAKPPFTWSWSGGGAPDELGAAVEQPPVVSPSGEYLAYLSTEGELTAFRTSDSGTSTSVPVPVRDEDGVGTRIGAVTDDGWVVASGRGVSLLWRPFDGGGTVDLTRTAPDQLVWRATDAGLVVVDGSGGATDPGSGRVYLADLSADGELAPLVDLPGFGKAALSREWMAWVPAEQVVGDVREYDEIEVRHLDGDDQGVLTPPPGWRFENTAITFEDDQFFVTRATDGDQQRMVRCSPALQECALLDAP